MRNVEAPRLDGVGFEGLLAGDKAAAKVEPVVQSLGAAPVYWACPRPVDKALTSERTSSRIARVVAPPSPDLFFAGVSPGWEAEEALQNESLSDLGLDPSMGEHFLGDSMMQIGGLPDEAWSSIFAFAVEVRTIGILAGIARGFSEVLNSVEVWRGRPVRLGPGVLQAAHAAKLSAWLETWRVCSKLVAPSSKQLRAEVDRVAPELEVEIACRFDRHRKGSSIEVLRNGSAARRVDGEDVVVLGDAPLTDTLKHTAFFEICLDELGESVGDGLNDFGIGVTACNPAEVDIGNDEDDDSPKVADEVPNSWVLDFAQSCVCLSVNNVERGKSTSVDADGLRQGDRVGVRVALDDGALELFINGKLRERFVSGDCAPDEALPSPGTRLFPVVDLYGRVVQLSLTEADDPRP